MSLMAGSSSGMASPGLISLTPRLIGQFFVFVFWCNGVSGFLSVNEFLSLVVRSVGPTSHVKKMATHNISFYIVYLVKLHGLHPFLLLLFWVRVSSLKLDS